MEGYGLTVPIQAISNGIDLEKYRPDPIKELKFREHFQLSEDQKVIICVGLFFARKGIIDFVDIAKKCQNIHSSGLDMCPCIRSLKKYSKIVKEDHPDNVIFPRIHQRGDY